MGPSQLFFSFSDKFGQTSSTNTALPLVLISSVLPYPKSLPHVYQCYFWTPSTSFLFQLRVNTLGMYFFLWTDYSGTWARCFFEFFIIINQHTLYIGEPLIVLNPEIGGGKTW